MKNYKSKVRAIFLAAFAVVFAGGCSGSYSTLGPVAGFPASCNGAVSFAGMPCPTNALWATNGAISISGVTVIIDSFASGAGPYGGANILATGNIQAGGGINVSGVGVTYNGTFKPNTPANLNIVSPAVAASGDLNISGVSVGLTLTAGDYYYRNINISGVSVHIYTPSGQVRIWFDRLNISGSSVTFGSTVPKDLWLLGTCGADANISGPTTTVVGVIYTPSGSINVSGTNCIFGGPLVGTSINLSGSGIGVHRDTAICGI